MEEDSAPKKKLVFKFLKFALLYLATTGVSYLIFGLLTSGPSFIATPLADLRDETTSQDSGPKDSPCPLNGSLFSKKQKEKWEKRRPLAIMIENHVETRPQLGLSRSDVIYEVVAEGGITRFMALYLCQDAGDVAPVRSARTYYLDWLSEYDAAYAHVGGANAPGPANALGQILDYKIKDMDQFGLGFPTFWRGADRFAPHNVHTTTKKLWDAAEKRGWTDKDEKGQRWDKNFSPWLLKNEAELSARGESGEIKVEFWASQGDYTVTWQYDKDSNTYKRFHESQAHIDQLTNEQLAAKVIIVQFQEERVANDGYPEQHLLYKTKGRGEALIIQDGKVVKGTWNKKDRTSRTKFLDGKGKEAQLNRGQIWIQTVPIGAKVTY